MKKTLLLIPILLCGSFLALFQAFQRKNTSFNPAKEPTNSYSLPTPPEQEYVKQTATYWNSQNWEIVIKKAQDGIAGRVPGLSATSKLELTLMLPKAYDKAGKTELAIKYYRRVFGNNFEKLGGDDLAHVGDLLDYLGDKAQARKVYEEYLNSGLKTMNLTWSPINTVVFRDVLPSDLQKVKAGCLHYHIDFDGQNKNSPEEILPVVPWTGSDLSYSYLKGLANYNRAQIGSFPAGYLRLKIALQAMPNDAAINLAMAWTLFDMRMNHSALIYFDRASALSNGKERLFI